MDVYGDLFLSIITCNIKVVSQISWAGACFLFCFFAILVWYFPLKYFTGYTTKIKRALIFFFFWYSNLFWVVTSLMFLIFFFKSFPCNVFFTSLSYQVHNLILKSQIYWTKSIHLSVTKCRAKNKIYCIPIYNQLNILNKILITNILWNMKLHTVVLLYPWEYLKTPRGYLK